MSAPTDELKEKIRQLESDEAFLELSKKYNALNLFEILKITKAEIRHSNFLAWHLILKGITDYKTGFSAPLPQT